jgi:hypothetical protein
MWNNHSRKEAQNKAVVAVPPPDFAFAAIAPFTAFPARNL